MEFEKQKQEIEKIKAVKKYFQDSGCSHEEFLKNMEKEVRELRKKISNLYYEEGFELDTPMLLKYIDKILDKGE